MSSPRDQALGFSDPDTTRTALHEVLWTAAIQIEIAERNNGIDDLAALACSLRRLSSYVKTALALAGDLAALRQSESGQ